MSNTSKAIDKTLVDAARVYRERLQQLSKTEYIAMRFTDIAKGLGLSEEDAAVMIAVHALECLKTTQQELLEAKMELPPDAFYIREEDGTRKLVRYIGPTIQELRVAAAVKAKKRD